MESNSDSPRSSGQRLEGRRSVRRDFLKYHKSIAAEMTAMKDRVRHLIGDHHWQSDGEHKEAVLRRLLRTHLAESLGIGRGFVCGEESTSSQIDVLVVRRSKPTLFRDGDMLLVTPDGKERRRKFYVGLGDRTPQDFGLTPPIAGRQPYV